MLQALANGSTHAFTKSQWPERLTDDDETFEHAEKFNERLTINVNLRLYLFHPEHHLKTSIMQ